jgi:hypothetical protein
VDGLSDLKQRWAGIGTDRLGRWRSFVAEIHLNLKFKVIFQAISSYNDANGTSQASRIKVVNPNFGNIKEELGTDFTPDIMLLAKFLTSSVKSV